MTTEQQYHSCADKPFDLFNSVEEFKRCGYKDEQKIALEIEEHLEIAKQIQSSLLLRLSDSPHKHTWETDLKSEESLDNYLYELEREVNWHEAKPKASADDTNYNLLTADELINGDYYLIGDIHYLVGNFDHLDFGYDEDLIARTPKCTAFRTGGDGGFIDQHRRFYTVESGTFGIMKASEIPKEEVESILVFFEDFQKRFPNDTSGLGHFVKLQNDDVYADELGHIWFGNREIVIDGNCMWDCTDNVGVGPVTGNNT